MAASNGSQSDWIAFREQMPVCDKWVFLDHAAVAPLSMKAKNAMVRWVSDQSENGVACGSHWLRTVEQARRAAATLIGSHVDEIAFVKNTSEGLAMIAEGVRWKAGDNVISVQEEYPANVYPWLNLQRRGVGFKRIPLRDGRIVIEDLSSAMDARTRLLTISFVEFATGFKNDLKRLAYLCQERNVLFCVDAIQGLGVFPIDVQKVPIDFLAADGHKWLLGPEGAGILFCRKKHFDQLDLVNVGWNSVVGSNNFSTIDYRLKPTAARWEGGSNNIAGIAGLGASLEWLLTIGIEQISERVIQLTDLLCTRLQDLGGTLVSSRRTGEKSGIVSVSWPTLNARSLRHYCWENHVLLSVRAGRIRISPHFYNTEEEIELLCSVLYDGIRQTGKP